MEAVADHIAARVSLSGVVGAIGGAALALYKGHRSLPRTAGMTAFSCALSATVCVGTERLFSLSLAPMLLTKEEEKASSSGCVPPKLENVLATHALGGFFGGAVLGGLYLGRPLRGSFFFVPFMILVGVGEHRLQAYRLRLELEEKERQEKL